MFNDLDTHLPKLRLCFDRCKFDINLNPEKYMFFVHLSIFLRCVVSKEGKLSNLKKILAIIHMLISKTLKDIQVFNGI
jgi:hypothetical protein